MRLLLVFLEPLPAYLNTGCMSVWVGEINPTASVMSVAELLIWDNVMELGRGKNCVLDASNNPRTRYLINDACVLVGRKPKTADMTNGVSDRGGVPIPMLSCSAMDTKGQLTVYNHRRGGGCYLCLYPKNNPMGVRNKFVAADKGLIRKDGKVISPPVRTRVK